MLKIGLNDNLERSGILKTKTLLQTSCINFVLSTKCGPTRRRRLLEK
jgi:hypothetical protein